MPGEQKNKTNPGTAPAVVFGSAFIVAGTLLIAGHFWNGLTVSRLWPLFLLVPVLFFIMALIQEGKKASGVLIPGVILVFLSCYFLFLNFTSWDLSQYTWPLYILAPALGFIAFFFTTGQKPILIPAFILVAVTIVCFGLAFKSAVAAAVFLILIGILLLVRSFLPARPGRKDPSPGEKK